MKHKEPRLNLSFANPQPRIPPLRNTKLPLLRLSLPDCLSAYLLMCLMCLVGLGHCSAANPVTQNGYSTASTSSECIQNICFFLNRVYSSVFLIERPVLKPLEDLSEPILLPVVGERILKKADAEYTESIAACPFYSHPPSGAADLVFIDVFLRFFDQWFSRSIIDMPPTDPEILQIISTLFVDAVNAAVETGTNAAYVALRKDALFMCRLSRLILDSPPFVELPVKFKARRGEFLRCLARERQGGSISDAEQRERVKKFDKQEREFDGLEHILRPMSIKISYVMEWFGSEGHQLLCSLLFRRTYLSYHVIRTQEKKMRDDKAYYDYYTLQVSPWLLNFHYLLCANTERIQRMRNTTDGFASLFHFQINPNGRTDPKFPTPEYNSAYRVLNSISNPEKNALLHALYTCRKTRTPLSRQQARRINDIFHAFDVMRRNLLLMEHRHSTPDSGDDLYGLPSDITDALGAAR